MRLVVRQVRELEPCDRVCELGDQVRRLARQLRELRLEQDCQVPCGCRQQHRARDRGRRLSLDVELRDVLLGEHLVPRIELPLGEDAVVGEQGDRLVADQIGESVGGGPQVEQPAGFGLGVPLLGVVVAAEDDPLVGGVAALDHGSHGLLERGAAVDRALELVGEVVDRLRHARVEDRVRQRQRHARAQRAELELVAREREGARPVAVPAVHRQWRQDRRTKAEKRARRGLAGLVALDRTEDLLEFGPEEDRDDRRRCLVCAKPMVLTG
jgi:hypothetical protein